MVSHWLFQKPGFMAEWWPNSAKLAINRDYSRSHHAPHWADAASLLEATMSPSLSVQGQLRLSQPQPTTSSSPS